MFDFNPQTGTLSILGDDRDNRLHLWNNPNSTIELELDGQRYSSDRLSPFFVSTLAEVNSQTLRSIEFAGGLGDDRLTLSDLEVGNAIAVRGDDVVEVAGNVVTPDTVTIEAATVEHNGTLSGSRIILDSEDETWIRGRAIARNGNKGGEVQVLGDRIALVAAEIDASGDLGGGKVFIGGERQGTGSLKNAQQVFIDPESNISTDAVMQGDGGEAIVFANESTRVFGSITARGGKLSGNGGFIETSGLQGLEITSVPDVGAAIGQGGEWLIDPYNIRIIAGSGNTNINTTSPFASTGNTAQLGVDLITAALANGDVTISTGAGGTQNGNIDLNTAFNFNLATERTLTLNAHRRIRISNPIQAAVGSEPLNVVLNANNGDVNSGTGNVYIQSSIVTGGGDITARGRATQKYSQLARGIEITSSGSLDSGGGDISLTGATPITAFQGVVVSGSILSGSGDITITGTAEYSQAVFIRNTVDSAGSSITIAGTGLNQRAITISSSVSSGGGDIKIEGYSTNNHAIYLNQTVDSGGGNVTITGTTGNASRDGIRLRNSLNSGSGTLTLTADRIHLNAGGTPNLQGTGDLTLRPSTISGNITVGGSGNSSATFLNDTELTRIQDGFSSITIGRSDSTGTVTIASNVTFNDPVTLSAATIVPQDITTAGDSITLDGAVNLNAATQITTGAGGGNIIFNSAIDSAQDLTIDAGTGQVNLLGNIGTTTALTALSIGGTLAPGGSGATQAVAIDIGANTLTFDTDDTLQFDLNGTTAGSQYDRLNLVGAIDLGNAALALNVGFTPSDGTPFILLENDGVDAIVGTFNGLAEGSTLTVDSKQFQISYSGGDGNDIVLTALVPTIEFSVASFTSNENVGTSNAVTLTRNMTGGTSSVQVSIAGGTAMGGGIDYTSSSFPLTVNFADGESSKTIPIPINDDGFSEPGGDETIILSVASISNAEIGTQSTATLNITDDDIAQVTIAETSASTDVAEGGVTDTYTVVLEAQPTADVIVNITPDSQTSVDSASLTFNSGNWDTPQTVTVTANDDSTIEGAHSSTITHAIAPGSAPEYLGVSISNVAVTITDNDFNDIPSAPGGQTVTGTGQSDRFIYNSIFDGGDTIANFTNGDDKIDISGVLSQIGYGGSDPIADSYLSFQSFGSHTIINLDIDGSATRGVPRGFLLVQDIAPGDLNNLDNFIL